MSALSSLSPSLPPGEREIALALLEEGDLSLAAAACGISYQAAKRRFARLMKRLQNT